MPGTEKNQKQGFWSTCFSCFKEISGCRKKIKCNGECGNLFHLHCVDIDEKNFEPEKSQWRCDSCKVVHRDAAVNGSSHDKPRKCSVKETEKLAKKIKNTEYRQLARLLGLNEYDIYKIDEESKDSNLGLAKTVVKILNRWEYIELTKATTDVLITALQDIDRSDLVQEIFPDCHFLEKNSLSNLQREIQFRQRKEFKHLNLPRSLWLKKKLLPVEEFFVELTMKGRNVLEGKMYMTIDKEIIFLGMDQIISFPSKQENISCRILIEGHPGYGKTTLILKFLSDWSNGEKYISDKFDLIFVIALRNYKDKLETHLLQQCEGIDGSDEEKLKAIESIGKRVLILLDGLDEASERVKENIFPLIKGEKYPSMIVVATCRTGFLQFVDSRKSFENVCYDGFQHGFLWDNRIQIKGFSVERQQEFLSRYFSDEFIEVKVLHELGLNAFCKCPLFLLLLTVLVTESAVRSIKTKTDLYKEIFNFVINRSLDREKLTGREFDVFNLKNADQYGYRSLLINFSRLCLEKIKHQSLLFEESELLKCSGGSDVILKSGIFSKQISFFNYEEKEHYEPVHRTFMEFLAAFYISSLKESQMKIVIKKLTLDFNIWPGYHQLLYLFLGGFLQSKAFLLFNALSYSKNIIKVFESDVGHYSLSDVLLEIPITDKILKSLLPFRPKNWKYVRYYEPLHYWYVYLFKEIQNSRLNDEIVLLVPDQIHIVNCLPKKIKVNTIKLHPDYEDDKFRLKKNLKLYCQNLYIESSFRITNCFVASLKNVLSKIVSEKISLKINDFLNSNAEELLLQYSDFITLWKNVLQTGPILYYLILHDMPPSLFSSISPLIQQLIKNGKVEHGISISIVNGLTNDFSETELKPFLDVVASSQLKAFGFWNKVINETLPFSIKDFSKVKRKWDSICLTGIDIEDSESISVENFYGHHEGFGENSFLNLLLKCQDIKKLFCTCQTISDLGSCESFHLWNGFETIERLDLDINICPKDGDLFWSVIPYFRNVREIHFVKVDDIEHVLKVLQLLPSVKRLFLYVIFQKNYEWMFLKKLQNFNDEQHINELHLDELGMEVTVGLFFNSALDLFQFIENCFKKNIFQKLSFFYDHVVASKSFLWNLVTRTNFKVSSGIVKEVPMFPFWNCPVYPASDCKISITY